MEHDNCYKGAKIKRVRKTEKREINFAYRGNEVSKGNNFSYS